MKWIKQNDRRIPDPVFRRSGCAVRCLMNIGEVITRKDLTVKQIMDVWSESKRQKWLAPDKSGEFNVVNNQAIINETLRILGSSAHVVEIGTFKQGNVHRYKWADSSRYKIDFCVQKIKQDGNHEFHFRRVSPSGEVEFDPYDPPITPVGIEYSILFSEVRR